jgi:hypothetical protein
MIRRYDRQDGGLRLRLQPARATSYELRATSCSQRSRSAVSLKLIAVLKTPRLNGTSNNPGVGVESLATMIIERHLRWPAKLIVAAQNAAEQTNGTRGRSSAASDDGLSAQLLGLDRDPGLSGHDVLEDLVDVSLGEILDPLGA